MFEVVNSISGGDTSGGGISDGGKSGDGKSEGADSGTGDSTCTTGSSGSFGNDSWFLPPPIIKRHSQGYVIGLIQWNLNSFEFKFGDTRLSS